MGLADAKAIIKPIEHLIPVRAEEPPAPQPAAATFSLAPSEPEDAGKTTEIVQTTESPQPEPHPPTEEPENVTESSAPNVTPGDMPLQLQEEAEKDQSDPPTQEPDNDGPITMSVINLEESLPGLSLTEGTEESKPSEPLAE